MSADVVSVGDVLAGKYRVERVLGQGGMGVVVAATHLALDQLVALKFMLPQATSQPDAVARFLREARAAVRLRSQHVGRVLDVGTLENGAPYIVMEYLDGEDLGSVLERQGSLPLEQAVGYVLQAIDALAEAHAAGIVHRDLKPANLFLTRQNDGSPLVKVLDFGISKVSLGNEGLTATSTIMGSPSYMSPEQLRASRDADARSDQWSLGVILYQLVSGQVPYSADSMPELCVRILTDPLPPLLQVAPQIPPGFATVVERCLEKDRNRRFANVAELALALEPYAALRERVLASRAASVMGVRAVSVPPPAADATLPPRTASQVGSDLVSSGITVPPTPARSGSERRLALAVGAGGLVLAVVIVAVLASGTREAARSPAAAQPTAPVQVEAESTPRAAAVPTPTPTPPPVQTAAPAPLPATTADAGVASTDKQPAAAAAKSPVPPARKASAAKPTEHRRDGRGNASGGKAAPAPAPAAAAAPTPAPASKPPAPPEDDPMDSRK